MKYALTLIGLLIAAVAHAQEQVEMADTMRSEGKIYVVLGIILIVLTGLLAYLFILDRKIARLEKEQAGRTS